jgi:hypothetical protein
MRNWLDPWEYALGVSRSIGGAGAWRLVAAAGGGVLSWQRESDPFIDVAADARRPLSSRAAFLVGFHAVMVPGLERQRREYDAIVEKKNLLFANAILGLSLQLW